MTGAYVPLDVLLQLWPPESIEKAQSHREEALVSQFVVSLHDEIKSLVFWYHDLVSSLTVLLP